MPSIPARNLRLLALAVPARGGALLEVLVSSVLLSVALLAVAPLFTRGVADVRAGAERSQAALVAAELIDREPAAGLWFYGRDGRGWLETPPPPPEPAIWVGETSIRSYPLSALADGRLDRSEALTEPPEEPSVVLLETEVAMARTVGGRVELTLRRVAWGIR